MLDNLRLDEKILIGLTALGLGYVFMSKKTSGLSDFEYNRFEPGGDIKGMDTFKNGFNLVEPIYDPNKIDDETVNKVRRFLKKNKELQLDMWQFIGTGSIRKYFNNWANSTYYGKENKYIGGKPHNTKYLKHDKKVYDSIVETQKKLPKGLDFPLIFQILAEDKQMGYFENAKKDREKYLRSKNANK
jgi:hypothetical protein